jgi:hypothetical protein
MPLDDPGWGEQVHLPKEPDPGRGRGPRKGGPGDWLTHPGVLVGGAIALVLLGVGVAQLAAGGDEERGSTKAAKATKHDGGDDAPRTKTAADDEEPTPDPEPDPEPAPDPEPTPDPEPEPTPDPVPAGMTVAQYAQEADAICARYAPTIQAAIQGNDVAGVVSNADREVAEIDAIEVPTDRAAEIGQYKTLVHGAIDQLRAQDPGATATLAQAYQVGASLGMTTCAGK